MAGTAIAVGTSELGDPAAAFAEASAAVRGRIGGEPDICIAFATAEHLSGLAAAGAAVAAELAPTAMIGCAAGGVVGPAREHESGPAAVVWGARLDGGTAGAVALQGAESPLGPGEPEDWEEGIARIGADADAFIVLADPYSFPTDALLRRLNAEHPAVPVLGGLASAAIDGQAPLLVDCELEPGGAALLALEGVEVLPCVSQGAAPVGPEIAITAAEGNVIEELAFKPAIERLGEVIATLPEREREQLAEGMLVGVVIDENRPEHDRGDFLVRPVVGADRRSGAIAIGEPVRVGQTIRLHVRDESSADADLRAALAMQAQALGERGAAGALLFTCNGRGSRMFSVPDHDALAVDDALSVPLAGLFCAGEVGPVGGRSFLHGFTATLAVFGA